MVQNRAYIHYQNFINTFIFYQQLFDNTGDVTSILNMSYPLFKDIITAQIEEKKREKKRIDELHNKNKLVQKPPIKKR